jgi:hypothetical protein
MATIKTRSSALAIKEETTEGTPIMPAGATDFLALQDDFEMSPDQDVLENAELRSSIGVSKPIQGRENPTASLSHYLRNSGTGGTAPNFGKMLKGVLGAVDDAGVEHDTVASSTTALIKVDTGEGATYQRGQAVLVKKAAGYEIRPVHSISSDDLTLGFLLTDAPGSGVNLGEAVTYLPANDGHPTFTVRHYLGNGGAIQMMSGARVTAADFNFDAGELINGSYSLEGNEYYFNPITLTTSNNKMDFDIGGSELNVSVTAKTYKDPHELASALQAAMVAGGGTGVTVVYADTTGKYTIAKASGELNLLWNTGANTAETIGGKLGFSVAADDTGVLTFTSDNAISFASEYTPSFDSADPLAAKDNEVYMGDADDNINFNPSNVSISISTPKSDVLSVTAVSGKSGSIVNSREITINVTANLSQYDADRYRRYRENTETRFMYNFGVKSGGNWVPGKCGCIYAPTAVVSAFNITDQDGLATLELELRCFVDSNGNGEFYVSFV